MDKLQVETIYDYQNGVETISRFKVHGGWIVRSQRNTNVTSESSVFVPDQNHEWVVPQGYSGMKNEIKIKEEA